MAGRNYRFGVNTVITARDACAVRGYTLKDIMQPSQLAEAHLVEAPRLMKGVGFRDLLATLNKLPITNPLLQPHMPDDVRRAEWMRIGNESTRLLKENGAL